MANEKADRRAVIVTGAGSGLGAAIAEEMGRRGWLVLANYSKNAKGAEEVVARCPGGIAVQGDVANDGDCRRLAQTALERWGRIDALINNAGTTKFVPHANLEGLSGEDFLRVYAVNVVGTFQMARACTDALRAANGSVVNISSVAATLGAGSSMAYGASKAALNALTMALARVLAPEVRVNAVSPGYVETPWFEQMNDPVRREQRSQTFLKNSLTGKHSTPQDVADAVAWLIEGGRQITGENVRVDAGFHVVSP